MLDLFRAEWQKTVGNKWVIGFLLWIFPVGALAYIIVMGLLALFMEPVQDTFIQEGMQWTTAMLGAWSFPSNLFGRMFLLGFTAVVFAGEYQWGTWKNIIPRRRRDALIGVKFLVLGLLVLFTFTLTSLIQGVGRGVHARIAGVAYGPPFSSEILVDFLGNYALQMGVSFTAVLITAIYAALAAMIMRSILGGVMVGVGVSIVEPLSALGFLSLARMFDTVIPLHLFRLVPFYNLENVSAWIQLGEPNRMLRGMFAPFEQAAPVDGVAFSLLMLLAWVILGVGLTLVLFRRQDITT